MNLDRATHERTRKRTFFIPPVLSLPVFLLEVRAQRAHVKPRRLRRPFNGAPSAPLGASRHFHYNKLRVAVVDVLGSAWSINLVNACSPTVVHGILLKLQLWAPLDRLPLQKVPR